MKITYKEAIEDTGATGNFFLPGTLVKNLQSSVKTISINLPDRSKIRPMHTCDLDIKVIQEKAKLAHIVPGLAHASLISISV